MYFRTLFLLTIVLYCPSSNYGFWLLLWYLLTIVLYVLLLFTASDYHFDIFNLSYIDLKMGSYSQITYTDKNCIFILPTDLIPATYILSYILLFKKNHINVRSKLFSLSLSHSLYNSCLEHPITNQNSNTSLQQSSWVLLPIYFSNMLALRKMR